MKFWLPELPAQLLWFFFHTGNCAPTTSAATRITKSIAISSVAVTTTGIGTIKRTTNSAATLTTGTTRRTTNTTAKITATRTT